MISQLKLVYTFVVLRDRFLFLNGRPPRKNISQREKSGPDNIITKQIIYALTKYGH